MTVPTTLEQPSRALTTAESPSAGTRSLRIGVVADRLVSGSTPKIVGTEARYLRELGHDAEIVSIMEGLPGGNQARDYLDGVPMRFLSQEQTSLRYVRAKFPLMSFFSLFHVASPWLYKPGPRDQYDMTVVHATYTCFFAQAMKRKAKIPYLAFIWDPVQYILPKVYSSESPLRFAMPALTKAGRRLDGRLVSDAEAVVLCSNFHRKALADVTDRPIEVVYPGTESLESIPAERGDYMLAVDRWDMGNIPDKLLGVLERMENKQARLKVVGFWYPPALRDRFTREVDRRGLQDRVDIEGPADRKRLRELYSGARVLLHPNEEVFGFVPHEAAGHGCPIIMPSTSGNLEVMKHGVHGLFPKAFSPEDYAAFADRLTLDERLARNMGEEAWKVVRKMSWRDHAAGLEKVIQKYV